jgi:hypothetical protein
MMKQLVRVAKAFPHGFFVAISLLLCLAASGASAAQKSNPASKPDCESASYKNKPPCAPESTTGQITVFWPKRGLTNRLARALNSKIEVWIDKAMVGVVFGDVPLTVSLPNGPHTLKLKPFDDYLENIRPIKETQITVSAQKPLYFQIVDQSLVITASELDAPTAQAVLAGKPQDERIASTSPATVSTPQAAVSGTEQKGKPNAPPTLAALTANATIVPTTSGTIYLYWPKPGLGFRFLDDMAADLPVFMDGKRIGAVKLGEYLVIKVPSGEHALGLDVGLPMGRLLKQEFLIGADSTRHFRIEQHDTFRMLENSPEEAGDYIKGLRQRGAIVQ